MIETGWLWIAFCSLAAGGQIARNAMQHELTAALGAVGATHVRFLFGLPFALLFLAVVLGAAGSGLPHPPLVFWPWILCAAFAQFAGNALMLAAMGGRSFVVVTALTKTEAPQVAILGVLFLGEPLTTGLVLTIVIATAGVALISLKGRDVASVGLGPALTGVLAGTMFALAAIGYRGAVLTLDEPNFVVAGTFTMATAVLLQTTILTTYLALREPAVLLAIGRLWRASLFAGFVGAIATEFLFLAVTLTTAANVRTFALLEVVLAQMVSRFVFRQPVSPRELLGIGLVVFGVLLLVWTNY